MSRRLVRCPLLSQNTTTASTAKQTTVVMTRLGTQNFPGMFSVRTYEFITNVW
jgi:hypothetical protein